MTTISVKSANGRTEWALIDGRLKETAPDSFTFTLTAEDTYTLWKLLFQGKDEILMALQKERGIQAQETIRVSTTEDALLTEQGPKTGAQSSITLDEGLRGAGQTMKLSRGA